MSNRTDDEAHSLLVHPEGTEDESSSNQRSPQGTPYTSALKRLVAGIVLSLRAVVRSSAETMRPSSVPANRSSAPVESQSEGGAGVAPSPTTGQTDTESHAASPDTDHPLVGVDPELLNPERRILQVLIVEGGVLEQSDLVERTRWTDSTISRTLCRMETQERVERRRDGNGKLVFLPQTREK